MPIVQRVQFSLPIRQRLKRRSVSWAHGARATFRYSSRSRLILRESFRTEPFDIRSGKTYWKRSSAFEPGAGYKYGADGAVMTERRNKLYDHPVAQAAFGLASFESFRLTGDRPYLDRAVAQANRLVSKRVNHRGAWFFPYPLGYNRTSCGPFMNPPWYSAMAQGEALALFVRLSAATGDPAWRKAANRTFSSFVTRPSVKQVPNVVHVFEDNLWLEEYPGWPPRNSGHVLNGHIFAMFGLYDYHQQTGDSRAAEIFQAAGKTVLDRFPDFRKPGRSSSYCLPLEDGYQHTSPAYHEIHARQLHRLASMTGDRRFRDASDLLREDFAYVAKK